MPPFRPTRQQSQEFERLVESYTGNPEVLAEKAVARELHGMWTSGAVTLRAHAAYFGYDNSNRVDIFATSWVDVDDTQDLSVRLSTFGNPEGIKIPTFGFTETHLHAINLEYRLSRSVPLGIDNETELVERTGNIARLYSSGNGLKIHLGYPQSNYKLPAPEELLMVKDTLDLIVSSKDRE